MNQKRNSLWMELLSLALQDDSPCLSGIHDNYLVLSVMNAKIRVAREMQEAGLLRTSGRVNDDHQVFYVTSAGSLYYEDQSCASVGGC